MDQEIFSRRLRHPPGRLALAVGLSALAAGTAAFFFGSGLRDLLFAPTYRPTPPPGESALAGLHQGDATTSVSSAHPLSGRQPSLPEAQRVALTTDRGNWIRIPSLSLNLPLAAARSIDERAILEALHVGVVRYPNGVEPGKRGVVAVAGHSTGEPWKGRYRFAFLHARKLQPGDLVHLDHQGTRYTYRVTGQQMINPKKTPSLPSSADRPKLAIVTCWPLWTTQQRLLVNAELSYEAPLALRTLTQAPR